MLIKRKWSLFTNTLPNTTLQEVTHDSLGLGKWTPKNGRSSYSLCGLPKFNDLR